MALWGPAAAQSLAPDAPRCDGCRWTLQADPSVLEIMGDTTLWFGRIVAWAFGPDRTVWVADAYQHDVVRLDLATRTHRRVGRRGGGPGEFEVPIALAVGDSFVYVGDARNRRISVLSLDGAYLRSVPLPPEIAIPGSMAVTAAGDLFVASPPYTSDRLVHRLDDAGRILASFVDADTSSQWSASTSGGYLWWDPAAESLWFLPRGAVFRVLELGLNGEVRKQIRLGSFAQSTPHAVRRMSDGSVRIRPSVESGAKGMFPLGGEHLVIVSFDAPPRTLRYDIVERHRGEWTARWYEDDPTQFAIAAESTVVYLYSYDEPDLLRSRYAIDVRSVRRR